MKKSILSIVTIASLVFTSCSLSDDDNVTVVDGGEVTAQNLAGNLTSEQQIVTEKEVKIIDPKDFQNHSTEEFIEGLDIGNYYLLLSSDKEFKNTLGESYSSYLIAIKDQIKSLDDEFGKQAKQLDFIRSSPSKGKEVRSNYFLDMLEGSSAMTPLKSELISEIDWHSEIQNSNNPSLSCELYKKNREYIKSQKNKEIITEVGLVVLPLIAGPAFRVGAWGLRASGLVKWGMRDELYINATRAISASSSSGVFVNELYRTVATSEKCSNSLNSFIEKSKQIDYQKYMQCNENLSNQVLLLALESAFVSGSGVVSALKTIELSRSYKKGETLFNVRNSDELHYYLETKSLDSDTFGDAGLKLTTKKGDYFVLNLNGPQSEVKDLSDNYWNYVADTYKKRLNLSDAEINGFIESSAKMSDRTTLIVSTPHNSRNTFRGGVALVSSKKADDLMPFEKATGINVKRVPGEKVGEIVRLTVSEKRGDRKLTNELVEQVISSIKGQDDMKKAYIYTSKSHQRLYQRMLKKLNIKATQINDLDRDVILELDVSDF